MKRSSQLLIAVAVFGGAAGVWLGSRHSAPQMVESAATQSLFGQSLNDLAGQPQALWTYRGQPLLVNFWATWCAPCVEEMPAISVLHDELAQKPIKIIGIGIDSPTNIREFVQRVKVNYPLYIGGMGGSELTRNFGNQAGSLPFTVLIGADGRVRKTYLGRLKMDQVRADIAAL